MEKVVILRITKEEKSEFKGVLYSGGPKLRWKEKEKEYFRVCISFDECMEIHAVTGFLEYHTMSII